MKVPAKAQARITTALKRFQPILESALARDVNESDTATIVTDMLAEIFGYDKFHEVTSEHQIRGTFCDLAVAIEGQLKLLIEVKAIGMELKDKHLRQAVNYAANQGLEWVVLTNGIDWHVYRIDFAKPIREDLVLEMEILKLNPRSAGDIENLYLLSKEALGKSALPEYYILKQATNRYVLGALIMSEPVLKIISRELKKLSPGIKVDKDQVQEVILNEVLKREVAFGEQADGARKKVQKGIGQAKKSTGRAKEAVGESAEEPPEETDILGDERMNNTADE